MDERSYDFRTPNAVPGAARPAEDGSAEDARENQPSRSPDAGTKSAGLLAILIVIPVLVAVVILQQSQVYLASAQSSEAARSAVVPPSPGDAFTIMSKIMVKARGAMSDLGGSSFRPAEFMTNIDNSAASPSEVLRSAMIAGELLDADAATDRLEQAAELVYESQLYETGLSDEAGALLLDDITALDDYYRGETLDDATKQRLLDHHGWFAEVAFLRDATEAEREAFLGGGTALFALLGAFGAVVVLATLAGFGLLITAIVLGATGKLRARFEPPPPGGSVYLETFVVFVLGFLLLQLGSSALAQVLPPDSAMIAGLALQWLLLPLALWPLVRGVSLRAWREQVGLVAPRGVFREIGSGILAYLAGIPLYICAAIGALLIIVIRDLVIGTLAGGQPEGPPIGPSGPINPIFELVVGNGVLGTVLIGSLVVLWAPLVEEVIFRGALYRHMRNRLYWLVAAVLSAMLFGMLHQYDVAMLLPVIMLGVIFAGVREWRGSLVGCITGHMLHNGTIFMLIMALASLMG